LCQIEESKKRFIRLSAAKSKNGERERGKKLNVIKEMKIYRQKEWTFTLRGKSLLIVFMINAVMITLSFKLRENLRVICAH
jgi:hypothetical protein